jgi:hypothetical protein
LFGEDEDQNVQRRNRPSNHQKRKGSHIRAMKKAIANLSTMFFDSHWMKEK